MSQTDRLFASPQYPTVPIVGENSTFPVHRIFCVGRNYVDHATEMGVEVDREAPFYFLKDAQAIVSTGATVPYPCGTENYHYEMELVIAIGRPCFRGTTEKATEAILGYAAGLDMTRRDIQLAARAKQRPWDLGKNFEKSAVIAPITRADAIGEIGPQRIQLSVGGTVRQDALLSDLVWSPVDIVSHLSGYYHLQPGDVIYTGTPAGVGAVVSGDHIRGEISGLSPVELHVGEAE